MELAPRIGHLLGLSMEEGEAEFRGLMKEIEWRRLREGREEEERESNVSNE